MINCSVFFGGGLEIFTRKILLLGKKCLNLHDLGDGGGKGFHIYIHQQEREHTQKNRGECIKPRKRESSGTKKKGGESSENPLFPPPGQK